MNAYIEARKLQDLINGEYVYIDKILNLIDEDYIIQHLLNSFKTLKDTMIEVMNVAENLDKSGKVRSRLKNAIILNELLDEEIKTVAKYYYESEVK